MDNAMTTAPTPRSVDAGRGLGWWTDAWALFMKNAGMWIVMGLITLVIFLVLGVIPILGGVAASLLGPVFVAGWLVASRKVENGATLDIGDLFVGFQAKLGPLVIIGALLLAALVVIGMGLTMLGLGAAAGMMFGHGTSGAGMAAMLGMGLVAMLVSLALAFVVSMAFWFAPGLVMFHDAAPFDALKASLSASLANVGAFLIYGILYIVAAIIASIPFALGWLVLVPVLMLTMYVSFKDVFGLPAA